MLCNPSLADEVAKAVAMVLLFLMMQRGGSGRVLRIEHTFEHNTVQCLGDRSTIVGRLTRIQVLAKLKIFYKQIFDVRHHAAGVVTAVPRATVMFKEIEPHE